MGIEEWPKLSAKKCTRPEAASADTIAIKQIKINAVQNQKPCRLDQKAVILQASSNQKMANSVSEMISNHLPAGRTGIFFCITAILIFKGATASFQYSSIENTYYYCMTVIS